MVGTADRSEVGMYRDRVDAGSSRRVSVGSAEIGRQEGVLRALISLSMTFVVSY
jgi:hypothetical protein